MQGDVNIKVDTLPPAHIAIIMDGNGRWAEEKGFARINGHLKGIEVVRDIVEFSAKIGIRYLTLYAFSRENWNRPPSEVKMLMTLLENHLRSELKEMMKNSIKFKAIGNLFELPQNVRAAINETQEKTSHNDGMTLQLALSYSGRSELTEAARSIARRVKENSLHLEDINEDTLADSLYTAGAPDPDLLIRTSGERRLSNFLLWQIAYTELYISDVLWPDFKREHLQNAIRDFQSRERRFGLTREQLIRVG